MNFDFHNLLFPEEFEKFCSDILEVREHPIKFTTRPRGRDGGIDIKSTNTIKKIIGQCKLYDPNNFSSLRTALKQEVNKCKRLKPDRYILCINNKLTTPQMEDILNDFKGFIHEEEDIIDGIKLNKYINDAIKYSHLLKKYSKLLVPNLHYIELALDNIVNKKYYNQTKSFLNAIAKEHKLYHNTKFLAECIEKLEKNNVLIITGNPGVGKTTTAKMIANYFIHQKIKDILFLSDFDFQEIEGLLSENQLIIIDDFWGQNFSPILKESIKLRNFVRIVNDFKNSSNRFLLLTSREYIIKDVLNSSEFDAKQLIDNERYIIEIDNYSDDDKVRILLNHLLYYDFEKGYFTHLKYSDILENIIEHKNYSPRHIEYYIKQYYNENTANQYNFFKGFYNYLDKPQEFWNNNFQKLNGTAQLILIIILISSDPIDILDLELTFEETQEPVRRALNKDIQPTEFYNEIKLLENFYLISEKLDYTEELLIRFQNHGIKDYLLEYLRVKGKAWIEPLIENAPFLNQLYFIFSTKEEEITDYESDNYLYGKKIVFSEKLQNRVKKKMLSQFHELNFSNPDSREFTDQLIKGQTSDETKYWKLILLNYLFDITETANEDVRSFIIAEVQKDINDFINDNSPNRIKIVHHSSMFYFPSVIKLIQPFLELDNNNILLSFYSSINFTKEFDAFYEFKDIFPTEFDDFVQKNIKSIKKSIRHYIIEDIEHYLWNEMDIEFDMHFDNIQDVCKTYGIRLTNKFIEEIEETAERPLRFLPNRKKQKDKKKSKKKNKKPSSQRYKPKKFDKIIEEYLPDYSEEFDALQYLKTANVDKELVINIKKDLKNENSILREFAREQKVFSAILEFLSSSQLNITSFNIYSFSDSFFNYYCNVQKIDPVDIKNFYIDLVQDSFGHDYSLTQTKIVSLLNTKGLLIEDLNLLSPIIIRYKNWFNFSSYDIKIYFILEYLKNINDDELFKEEVIDYTNYIHEPNLLTILDFVCKKRVTEIVVIPELENLISQIDYSSAKSIVLSFLKYMEREFTIVWNKQYKSFEIDSSVGSFLEYVLPYLEIDFEADLFEIYFCKMYYSEENAKKYCIESKNYKILYDRIIKTVIPEKKTYIFDDEELKHYNIVLYDFACDAENYESLKAVGLEKYIINLFEEINLKIQQIK